jgi:hypothetical protein
MRSVPLRVWAGTGGRKTLHLQAQAACIDGVAGRQISLARALKLMHLIVQSFRRFLKVGDFSVFGLQSIGKTMGAGDQGSLGAA